ncbi:META domain-containing protein [Gordonia sp. (in: high G+C Gram-positive bacteria)]|uniref:META domain-containing protein n=1 Tax=Gordonia sp. (in: high G+C Gram-positive bacteria) TaxID=84139 RepID=UPI0039E5FAD5
MTISTAKLIVPAAAVAAAAAVIAVPAARSDAAPQLFGKSFISTSVTPQIPGGGPLKMTFLPNGRVGLTAGCNQMSGTVKTLGGRLHFSRLASTMMACPPPRNMADGWADGFTRQAPRYTLRGNTLTLRTRTTTAVLHQTRYTG